ncbi:MAG: adenylyltransferase/cytidyltransferase family protein [Candidatus Aminicenantes bacterium]|nr:adenylyltransferase/cytidyltransferase family protein [Candidatus Aminicenantes bacterium]
MKIYKNAAELNKQLSRRAGTIVFTNGVFDILHPGHIDLLEFARQKGDALVLGINDDDSVKRLNKGEDRPVFPLSERMEVLAAVEFVDFIIPFSQDTPLELIRSLSRVDIMVKGGDYRPEEIAGREEVEKGGGKLFLFEFKSDYSTSSLIKKVKTL